MFDQFSSESQENLLSPVGLATLNSSLSTENAVIVPVSGLSPEQNINQPVTVNPADRLLLSGIGGLDTAGAVTLVNNNSSDALTGEAMNIAKGKLLELAQSPDFIEKMNIPFGENWNREVANILKQNWLQGDFSFIPPVEIVSKGEIAGANGAFAQATDTIYLSQKFLRENGTNSQAVADVLLEEIGHSIDSKINVTDSPGDEGEIFGGIVQGKEWSSQEFSTLKTESDNGTIIIGEIRLPVEQQSTIRIKKQRDFNGDNISDLLRQEKGLWVNNSRDAEVYLSNGSWGFKQQNVLPDGYWMNGDLVNFIYGDFNGDNKTDFIRQEKGKWVDGGNDVNIFISRGDGTFLNPVNMNEMSSMNGNNVNLIVGDFNGNGTDDIIRQEKGNWVNGVNDTQFYTYSNGNFVKVRDVPDMAAMNGNYTNLIAGDFDGNGITDLIRQEKGSWINNTRDAEVYLSNGSWGFKQQTVLPDSSWMNGDLINLISGDFNGDRKTDFIRQEKGGWVNGINDVNIFISKGDGTFQNSVNINDMGMMNGNVANLIVGDFTGEGADDIIRQSKNSGDAQFYTFSAGNFRKVGNVPDMAAMNGSGVNLAPQIDGASSYPYAAPPVQIQVPVNSWKAEYFNNNYLAGTPVFTRSESLNSLNYNWGSGGPGNGLNNDNFSARWTGVFNFDAGNYTFKQSVDDGMRVWVNGNLIHDTWSSRNAVDFSRDINMTAGQHTVKVEYKELGGDALAKVSWEKAGNRDIDIQLVYPYGGFTDTQKAIFEQAAKNWENVITKDKVPYGVLKIAITQGSKNILGNNWNSDIAAETYSVTPEEPPNVRYDLTTNPNLDGHNQTHFNSAYINGFSKNNLIRLTMHEMGHALGLNEANQGYDTTLLDTAGDSLMDLRMPSQGGQDMKITEGMNKKLEYFGYGVNRSPSINWY
jgi:hypothetical protein